MTFANAPVHEFDASALIARCLEGDQLAWKGLIDRYGRLVYSIPRRYGLCESDADDAYQNVFALLYRRMATIRDRMRLSAWLITVTHRVCWRIARKRGRDCALSDRLFDSHEAPAALAAAWERQHMVREALGHLAPRERALLEALVHQSGQNDYETIARRLGMKPGSIGPTRARYFKKLERILLQLGFDGARAPSDADSHSHEYTVQATPPAGHVGFSRSKKFPRKSLYQQVA